MVSQAFVLTIINPWLNGVIILLFLVIVIVLLCAISILSAIGKIKANAPDRIINDEKTRFKQHINAMNSKQISEFINLKKRKYASK